MLSDKNSVFYKLMTMALAILLHHQANAASDTSRLLQFNIENGFPSNNVYSVIQDRHGYLWFATENGVVKYNGYSMRVFNTNDGLPSNDVWQLYEDGYDRIWLFSFTYQLGYIKNDKYSSIDFKTKDRVLKPDQIVQANNSVYFTFLRGYFEKSLAMVDTSGHTTMVDTSSGFASILSLDSIFYSLHRGFIKSFYLKGRKKILKATYNMDLHPYYSRATNHQILNDLLYLFAFKDNKVLVVDLPKEKMAYKYIADLGANDKERIYHAQFTQNGCYILTNENIYSVDRYLNLKKKIKITDVLPAQLQVSYVFNQSSKSIIWYCTNLAGAWLQLPNFDLFNRSKWSGQLTNASNIRSSLGDRSFWLADDKKTIYAISSDNQLNYLFSSDDELRAITSAENGLMYMAFANGLYKLTTDGKIVEQVGKTSLPMCQHENGEIVSIIDSLKPLRFKNFSIIHSVGPGHLVAASSLAVESFKFSDTCILALPLIHDKLTSLFVDSGLNRYCFYNKENISILNLQNNTYLRINSGELSRIGIAGISSIATDIAGNILIHAGSRLFLYNFQKSKFTGINVNANVSNAKMVVYKDVIALAGNFGFAFAKISGTKVGQFTIYPNPRGIYYNNVVDFLIHDSLVQISTDKAFYSFSLDEVSDLAADMQLDYISFVRKSQGQINNEDTLIVDQQYGKIDFDAVNYYGVGDIQYQYKIPLKSNEWYSTGSGEIVVSGLAPGVYHSLYLVAKDDSWESKPYRLYVYIVPYWYQTNTWKNIFWITGVVFTILLITLVIFLTRYFVARANEKKQSLVDMELRALYSQINPHFIFNTLSTALFFISKRRYNEAYNHVSRFSKLLRTYLTSSRKRYVILAEEIEMIRNYIELQQIRFEEKFNYSIEVDNKVPSDSIQIPTLLLQPLVENAINHGLFHRSSGGFLSIRFMHGKDNKELICIIEDNGVGRQKSREIKKASVVQHESYGTMLTEELIEIFKKYEDMNIYLEYTDKTGEETGTIVQLTIRNLKYVA